MRFGVRRNTGERGDHGAQATVCRPSAWEPGASSATGAGCVATRWAGLACSPMLPDARCHARSATPATAQPHGQAPEPTAAIIDAQSTPGTAQGGDIGTATRHPVCCRRGDL
jgi:hypothetical protein